MSLREVKGTCPECKRTLIRRSPVPLIAVCDCYLYCDICGAELTPYTPDLNPRAYRDEKNIDPLGLADRNEASVATLYVCYNHVPPHYSGQEPVEVLLE